MDDERSAMASLQKALADVNKLPRLSSAAEHVDKIIELLTAAREHVAGGSSTPPSAPLPPSLADLNLRAHLAGSLGSSHDKFDHDEASEPDQSGL